MFSNKFMENNSSIHKWTQENVLLYINNNEKEMKILQIPIHLYTV